VDSGHAAGTEARGVGLSAVHHCILVGQKGATPPGCGPKGVPGGVVYGLHAGGQSRAVAIASRTVLLSGSRYRSGLSSHLDWLDAERTELRSRRQAVQVRSAQYVATVGLVLALGGGWE
jgi:hypothetical protein